MKSETFSCRHVSDEGTGTALNRRNFCIIINLHVENRWRNPERVHLIGRPNKVLAIL